MVNEPVHDQRRRGLRGPRAWMVVVVTVVAALGVGGAAGAFAGSMNGGPEAPIRPPPPPAEFPDAGMRYLPEVTVERIQTRIVGSDYECDDTPGSAVEGKRELFCISPFNHGANASVVAGYDDKTQVRLVYATCEPGPFTDEDCPAMFMRIAEAVFVERPQLKKQVRSWVKDNVRNDAVTIIGGIQMTADLGRHTLSFVPEG